MRWLAVRALTLVVVLAGAAGCAGSYYVRGWAFEGMDLTDRLYLSGKTFQLERISPDGISVFSGRFQVQGEEWRFEIDSWKPVNEPQRRLNPPVVYVYRGRSFQKGLAFYSFRVLGRSPLTLFIRSPSDFDMLE
jgi:hypothetical protein